MAIRRRPSPRQWHVHVPRLARHGARKPTRPFTSRRQCRRRPRTTRNDVGRHPKGTLRHHVGVDVDDRVSSVARATPRAQPWHQSQGVCDTLIFGYAPAQRRSRGNVAVSLTSILTSSSTRTRRSPSTATKASSPNTEPGGCGGPRLRDDLRASSRDPARASDPEKVPTRRAHHEGVQAGAGSSSSTWTRPTTRASAGLGEGRASHPRAISGLEQTIVATTAEALDALPAPAASTSPPRSVTACP